MTTDTQEKISLYYRAGGSDKVYHVQLDQADAGFIVHFQFGRRNSTLQTGTKTPEPVSYDKAKKIYDKLIAEKKGRGYTEGEDGAPYQGSHCAARQSGLLPQLLNAIDEEDAVALIADECWYMQEKKDGWRLLLKKHGAGAEGGNRQGLTVPLSRIVEQAALDVGGDFIFDGESIGDVYWVFDLLELDGEDLRGFGFAERFDRLTRLMDSTPANGAIRLVPTATTTTGKRKMLERLRTKRAEGVVFKQAISPYVPGRPSSGGSQRKLKFTASATCKVLHWNEGKRSVALAVYQYPGDGWVEIGNVTVPSNFRMPPIGALVEVRYLYAFVDGSLYQPVYLGERKDVDCADSVNSLKFKQGDSEES